MAARGHAAGALRGGAEREWSADRRDAAARLGLPVFVKPARLGSSVGISKVGQPRASSTGARGRAARTTRVVIVEAAAVGIEVECSVIGNDEPAGVRAGRDDRARRDWYDYEAKYTEGGMELVVPAPITAAQRERVRRIAREAFLRSSAARAWRASTSSSTDGARCCSTS